MLFIDIHIILYCFFQIFTFLPRALRTFMLSSLFSAAYGAAPNHVVDAGLKLIQPTILGNVFYLFKTEVHQIKELDVAVINLSGPFFLDENFLICCSIWLGLHGNLFFILE